MSWRQRLALPFWWMATYVEMVAVCCEFIAYWIDPTESYRPPEES